MAQKQIESFLISSPFNRRYITGFTGSNGIALVTQSEAIFITDFRYIEQVKEQCPHFRLEVQTTSIWATLGDLVKKLGLKELAIEEGHITFANYRLIEQAVGETKLVAAPQWIEDLRLVKTEDELVIIRKAANIADQAFERIIQEMKPGMREIDVQLRLEVMMREMGATSSSFDIIVASGARSALPHGVASEKVIEQGDLVTLDFGALYKGYISDLTRTVILGKPSEKQREIYDIVLEAGKRAIAGLCPGATGIAADALARDYISSHGYGELFGHSTGHGIGLEVHEGPNLSKVSKHVLVPGHVVTVEPGIYIPNFGGVRIEDDVLITESGHEVLTHSTKELITL